MIDPLNILPGERNILRLFALELPSQQLSSGNEQTATELLGVNDLDPEQIDLIDLADLTGIGLSQYLVDGFAISPDQLDHASLDALTGQLLIIRSAAFRGSAATLTLSPHLTPIATISETPTNWTGGPLPTKSAHSRLIPRAERANARRNGATIFAVVVTLMILIVILVAT